MVKIVSLKRKIGRNRHKAQTLSEKLQLSNPLTQKLLSHCVWYLGSMTWTLAYNTSTLFTRLSLVIYYIWKCGDFFSFIGAAGKVKYLK